MMNLEYWGWCFQRVGDIKMSCLVSLMFMGFGSKNR